MEQASCKNTDQVHARQNTVARQVAHCLLLSLRPRLRLRLRLLERSLLLLRLLRLASPLSSFLSSMAVVKRGSPCGLLSRLAGGLGGGVLSP